jgi:hypothetical protein
MKKNDNDKTTRVSQRKRVVWFFYEQQIFESLSTSRVNLISLSLSPPATHKEESLAEEKVIGTR